MNIKSNIQSKTKLVLAMFAVLLLVGCDHGSREDVLLKEWSFLYDDIWYNARVPGCIHTDLQDQGLIDNPFYADNEDSVRWVEHKTWTYRASFNCPASKYENISLLFEGIDTYADIFLNDSLLGKAANMFRPHEFVLSRDLLKKGTNVVTVRFYPTGAFDSTALAALGYDVPDHRVFTRKAPYQQGWDWGPRLNTCGLWKPVHLVMWNSNDTSAIQVLDDMYAERVAPYAKLFPYKDVRLIQDTDSIGQSFTFQVDGKPLFIKGANWIPAHSFPIIEREGMRQRYRHLLCSAKDCGFNMIRVWGGGIYEPEFFYDLCDSLGLMVWQDFMYSCAFYPGDEAFLDEARAEARYQVRRISRHPCVVLWCGNNEVQNGWEDWGWQQQFGYTEAQQQQIKADIERLFGVGGLLDSVVKEYGNGRQYIATSPLYGWGHPECVTHGDSHYWGVWWGEQPFEIYATKTGRFMSEYGFQSYPAWSTIQNFCPKNQLTINSPTMIHHQKHGRGVEIIDKAMREYYGVDSRKLSLEDYCYVSQLLQAWGVGYGILQHIKHQPHCMGTLFWQLNDCWPVASWSSIDYYGNWKALQYRVRDLFSDDVNLQKWESYYSRHPKAVKLHKPRYKTAVSVKKGVLYVTLNAENMLRDVMLQTSPHVDGHFEDNYFDMKPGQQKTVKFIPYDRSVDISGIEVTVKTLNDIIGK